LQQPDMVKRLSDMATEPGTLSPQQFDDFLKAEVSKWTRLVKDVNLHIEP